MAARIYSDFPERKLTHDSGRPAAGTPLKGPTGVSGGVVWPSGSTGPSPMAPLTKGEKPKQAGGTFRL